MLKEKKYKRNTLEDVEKINPKKSPKDFGLYRCSGIIKSTSPICIKFAKELEAFEENLNELMCKSIKETPDEVNFEIRPVSENTNSYWFCIDDRKYGWWADVVSDFNSFAFQACIDNIIIHHSFSMDNGEEIAYTNCKTNKFISFKPSKGILTGTINFDCSRNRMVIVNGTEIGFDSRQIRRLLDNIGTATQSMQDIIAEMNKQK